MPDKNTGEQEWPEVELCRRRGHLFLSYGQTEKEAETYVPLHSIRERLISDEAVEATARVQWTRTRVRDQTKRGRPTILQPWESLPPEVTDQLLHEARRDLEAALQAAFPKEEN